MKSLYFRTWYIFYYYKWYYQLFLSKLPHNISLRIIVAKKWKIEKVAQLSYNEAGTQNIFENSFFIFPQETFYEPHYKISFRGLNPSLKKKLNSLSYLVIYFSYQVWLWITLITMKSKIHLRKNNQNLLLFKKWNIDSEGMFQYLCGNIRHTIL